MSRAGGRRWSTRRSTCSPPRGWAALSARRICEQAGLTRRYFYESFDDLDALLGAAFDRITGPVTQAVGEAVSAAIAVDSETPLPELVARAVSAGIEVVAWATTAAMGIVDAVIVVPE